MDGRLGGPVGAHARRGGVWFNPLPWALLASTAIWVLAVWRHKPCQQHVPSNQVNAFLRLCYSDVPVAWQNTGLGHGIFPLRLDGQGWAPLTGLFVALSQGASRLFGAHSTPTASPQQVVDGAGVFFLVSAVLLFCCLVVLVCCQTLLGRDSAAGRGPGVAGRVRSWDVLLVAAAPVLFTSSLVSWDLFAVSLAVAALLAWAVRRPIASGVLFGLAIGAGVWPVLVLLAVGICCLRAGRAGVWLASVGTALATLLVLTAGIMAAGLGNPWSAYASVWWQRRADLGSVWFLLDQLHLRPGAGLLGTAVLALMVVWVGWVALLGVAVAPRRPRIGQVGFLLVAGWLLLDKGYSPQQVLWLVPLVALARPVLLDWAVWSGAEVLYWAAVWGHLGGMTSPGDGGPDGFYWAAIVLRWAVLFWLVQQVAHDIRHPWDDPVRAALVDDPVGGVLDHMPDLVPVRSSRARGGSPPRDGEFSDGPALADDLLGRSPDPTEPVARPALVGPDRDEVSVEDSVSTTWPAPRTPRPDRWS